MPLYPSGSEMRNILVVVLFILAGCASGSTGASDTKSVLAGAIGVLLAGIEKEDAILASQPIGDEFFLGANVGARYRATEWDANNTTSAVSRFRIFFDDAFRHLANAHQEFVVSDVQVNGDIANVTVESRFDAVRTDTTPAENVTYNTTDYMLFELQGAGWRLVRWDEQPPTS